MANVSHASLTGSNLHILKGADTAALGTVPVANGAGDTTWQAIGTSSFTGMIADFAAPVAPAGWLELDGSVVSTSTYAALYAVMSITTSGTRTNGSPIITSIGSTATLKPGYFVLGTGITSGSTIVTVDSGTQITISNSATSSGSSVFAVSPWLLNTGTIKLPDVVTTGLYRRSRASGTTVGQVQASQNLAHTHTGTTGVENANHSHSGTTGTMNSNTSHTHTHNAIINTATGASAQNANNGAIPLYSFSAATINATNTDHTHAFSTGTENVTHAHAFTTDTTGSTEARPSSIIVLTCVKT